MPMSALSVVLRTNRTSNVVAPSRRMVCQSFPPSNTMPDNRSPSKDPPGTTPIRRVAAGAAPRIFDQIVEGLRRADIDAHLQILIQLLGGTAFDFHRHVSLAGDVSKDDSPDSAERLENE